MGTEETATYENFMIQGYSSFVAQVLLWNQSKTEIHAKENIWLTLALYMFKMQRETLINLIPLEREFNFLKPLH